MAAYVNLVQRKEREIGCDVLTHQKVSRLLHTPRLAGLRPSYEGSLLTLTSLMTLAQWSGAEYVDGLLKTVTGGVSSTAAMGKEVTESQFGIPPSKH